MPLVARAGRCKQNDWRRCQTRDSFIHIISMCQERFVYLPRYHRASFDCGKTWRGINCQKFLLAGLGCVPTITGRVSTGKARSWENCATTRLRSLRRPYICEYRKVILISSFYPIFEATDPSTMKKFGSETYATSGSALPRASNMTQLEVHRIQGIYWIDPSPDHVLEGQATLCL